MKKLCVLSICAVFSLFAFPGCDAPEGKKIVPAAPAKISGKRADHQVLVLLGPDYAARPGILAPVTEEYGIAGSGGMVLRMFYPESFTVDKKVRLSMLADAAKASSVSILVAVGAPEGTVRELTKIRAARPDMKILALFSADEVLPLEAVSDLVLDQARAEELLAEENASAMPDQDLAVLIAAAMLSGEVTDPSIAPLDRLAVGLEEARRSLKLKTAGTGWKLAPFVDPDTGLRSRNHVILQVPSGGSQ